MVISLFLGTVEGEDAAPDAENDGAIEAEDTVIVDNDEDEIGEAAGATAAAEVPAEEKGDRKRLGWRRDNKTGCKYCS